MGHAETSPVTPSFAERHHFLLRRLHSLAGIVPVGVFVIMHLSVNASIGAGAGEFQKQVNRIHDLGPVLVPVEIVGIFLPLLFHALMGFQIWFSGRPNSAAYPYGANYRYTLQRVTGGIAFVFIVYHLWQMHWLGSTFGGGVFDPHDAASTAAAGLQDSVWVIPVATLYGIGVISTVYHLANGIWTALITWGLTIGPSSQRVSGYACTAFGLLLGLAGLSAVYNFARLDTKAAAVASAMQSAEDTPPAGSHSG
ncbi:MAG: succinate dehydrogenase [Phycisphaerales bacterium]|nr:succinate dehydrogenase [Phycisphaerales bacterium]